jgi:hypothetical protein
MISVSIYDDKFWYQIFRAINEYFRVDWVSFRGNYYYNCSTIWREADITVQRMVLNGVVPSHPDRTCHGDHVCSCPHQFNRYVAPEVKYFFSGAMKLDDFERYVICDDDDPSIHPILQQLEEKNPQDIKFISDADIIIVNNCGFNHDHRGSDHTVIRLPFVQSVNLGREFTFFDLLTANANLKSHKFDYCYELFCGAFINEQGFVELEFDHGS